MTTPTRALNKLLKEHRNKPQGLHALLRPRMPGIYNAADYEPLQQVGAAEAFIKLSAKLQPEESAQFAFSLSQHLPNDAPIQTTLGNTYAAVAEGMEWYDAYLLLNSAHLNVHPNQAIHKVVVEQLIKLEERSDPDSKASVTHMLKTMPGAPYPDV